MRVFDRNKSFHRFIAFIAVLIMTGMIFGGCRAVTEGEGASAPTDPPENNVSKTGADEGDDVPSNTDTGSKEASDSQDDEKEVKSRLYQVTPERSVFVRVSAVTSQLERDVAMTLSEFRAEKKDEQTTRLTLPDDILFDFDSFKLRPEAENAINKIYQVLEFAGEEAKVTIIGHTDNVGSEAYNQKLSEKRAQAVLEALVKKGIDRDRMTALGKGMTDPVADNSTEEGRQKNRRVEILIEGLPDLDVNKTE